MSGAVRHGTTAGYQAHRLANTPACEPCRAAHRTYLREYRQRKAAEAATGLPQEAVDTVALALELELGGRVSTQALRWAAVIALRTALAVLDAQEHAATTDRPGQVPRPARRLPG